MPVLLFPGDVRPDDHVLSSVSAEHVRHVAAETLDERHNRDNGRDGNDDTKRGQERAALVGPDLAKGRQNVLTASRNGGRQEFSCP